MGFMFKYFGYSWMFVELNGWVLSADDIASRFGGVRGCSRILQIPENLQIQKQTSENEEKTK